MMKRSYFYNRSMPNWLNLNTPSENLSTYFTLPHYPVSAGPNIYGVDRADTGAYYNYTGFNPMSWLDPVFLGKRGSVVWRLVRVYGEETYGSLTVSRIRNPSPQFSDYAMSVTSFTTTGEFRNVQRYQVANDPYLGASARASNGTAVVTRESGVALEVLSPPYNTLRFNSGDGTSGLFEDEAFDTLLFENNVGPYGIATYGPLLNPYDVYCSAGEDFNYYCFLGAAPIDTGYVLLLPKYSFN
jgi:hypothetical protein